MKKIIISIILVINFISFGYSKEITLVNGNPAGSSTDNVIRMIGEEYEKRFGDKFVQIYQPGGGGKVALAKFFNSSPDHILIGSTAIHIWNFLLDGEKNYSNNDFKIVSFIGTGPKATTFGSMPSMPATDHPTMACSVLPHLDPSEMADPSNKGSCPGANLQ